MNVDVRVDVSAATKTLADLAKQTRYATSRAINASAADVVVAEHVAMKNVLDRPTAYTLNSLRVDPSRRDKLEATVLPKDGSGSNRSAAKWLDTEVAGGARRATGAERALRAAGVLPSNRFIVPAAGAEFDAFGNWKRSQLSRILLDLRVASGTNGAKLLNVMRRDHDRGSRKLSRYMVLRVHSKGLQPGIYERRVSAFGHGVRPVVLFVPSAPRYKPRLPFDQVGRRAVDAGFAKHFERELAEALRTARTGQAGASS
ncbi:hypothetical protein GN316_15400 [Xylophilus sp. Kf1]|nr:hypothetical protein [Xylophilus sp. Kf1]